MNIQFTITIVGDDKPNVINELASVTHTHGGKWLSSKISRLDHQVVGIIRIDIPKQSASQLKDHLSNIEEFHVRIVEHNQPLVPTMSPVHLKIESRDRPGIIHDLTEVLVGRGVQIDNIEAHRFGVPEAGQTVFAADVDVMIPEGFDWAQLINTLEQLDEHLKVAIDD